MKNIINIWNNLPTGKKVYTVLWIFFSIMLVAVVLTASLNAKGDSIAAVAFVFLISLISSIFTTVYVNIREAKRKNKEKK